MKLKSLQRTDLVPGNNVVEIDGTIYRVVTSIDKYTDTEIGLVNRDLNVNIELLLEEGGN